MKNMRPRYPHDPYPCAQLVAIDSPRPGLWLNRTVEEDGELCRHHIEEGSDAKLHRYRLKAVKKLLIGSRSTDQLKHRPSLGAGSDLGPRPAAAGVQPELGEELLPVRGYGHVEQRRVEEQAQLGHPREQDRRQLRRGQWNSPPDQQMGEERGGGW